MHKTPTKHKRKHTKHSSHNIKQAAQKDVNKIKAFLRKTTNGVRRTAHQSLVNIKEKTNGAQRYLGRRPMKTIGVSLATGLVTGVCLGYLIHNNKRKTFF